MTITAVNKTALAIIKYAISLLEEVRLLDIENGNPSPENAFISSDNTQRCKRQKT